MSRVAKVVGEEWIIILLSYTICSKDNSGAVFAATAGLTLIVLGIEQSRGRPDVLAVLAAAVVVVMVALAVVIVIAVGADGGCSSSRCSNRRRSSK